MRIVISFDDELLMKYAYRGTSVVFGIAWEHQNLYYPSKDWIDFGAIILGWWCASVESLWHGADEADFFFMDGPYRPKATYEQISGMVRLQGKGLENGWVVPITELTESLMEAASVAHLKLKQMNIEQAEVNSLEKWVTRLQPWLVG